MELWEQISEAQRLVHLAVSKSKERGIKLAEAERDYKIALANRIIELKAEGNPATLILELAKGTESVANLRFERDMAKATYLSACEAINAYKLDLRLLQAQYEREWSNVNENDSTQ